MIAAPIIGHRGAAGVAPENTLAAVHAAAECGLRWVEVDVQLSRDGRAVVFHDATLERCTDGCGSVVDYDYRDLAVFDAGFRFEACFRKERIPLLCDLLAFCRERCIGVNMELKAHPGDNPDALAFTVLETAAQYGPEPQDMLISSFCLQVLRACRYFDDKFQLGFICASCPDDLDMIQQRIGLVTLHCAWPWLQRPHVDKARNLGLEVYTWTINDPEYLSLVQDWQVSGVFTDHPQRLIDYAPVASANSEPGRFVFA